MSQIIKLTARRLRPPSLPGGPGWVERCRVSRLRRTRLAKLVLLVVGVAALAFGLWLLVTDDPQGTPAAIGGIGLLGWGLALPLRYSVDLHGRGAVRSLLVTPDPHFAERVFRLINAGLADPAAMPTYYIDPKTKRNETD